MFTDVFSRNKAPALIPFFVAGFPSLEATERLVSAVIDEGARAIEIGVPFSDPLADGPVIQAASEVALRAGTTLADVMRLIERLRVKYPKVPFIVFSYLNPLLRDGIDTYVRRACEAGAAATLTVDLPPEEAESYLESHARQGLKTVFLASPTTSAARLRAIADASTGFIYYVSRAGVTGVQEQLSRTLADETARVRVVTPKPLAIGFGISNGSQAAEVAHHADAVVVGSAFVRLIQQNSDLPNAEREVRRLARECVTAMAPLQKERSEK